MSTKTRKERSDEQRQIFEFFERIEMSLHCYATEVGGSIEENKFTRHDGHTYSIKLGDKKLVIKCEFEDIHKKNDIILKLCKASLHDGKLEL